MTYYCCSACLSVERALKHISDLNHLEYIIKWFANQNITFTFLCWECEGILNKLHTFKLRCLAAQDLMKAGKVFIKRGSSMSRLATSIQGHTEYVRHTHTDTDHTYTMKLPIETEYVFYKEEIEIKEEYDSEETLSVNSVEILDDETRCDETSRDETSESFRITFEEPVQIKKHKTTKTKISPAKISNAPTLTDLPTVTPSTSKCSKTSEPKEEFSYINYDEKNYIITRMTQDEMMKCWLKEVDEKKSRISFLPFKCEFCFQGCFHETKLKEHLNKYHNISNPYKCPICKKTFPTKEKQEIHRECHYKMYKCRDCDYSDHRIQLMMKHTDKEHYVLTYYCKVCEKPFLSFARMKHHRAREHGKKVTCELCNNDIPKILYKMHMRTKHSGKEQCPHCPNSYTYLTAHIKYKHSNNSQTSETEGTYCAECDKTFKTRYIYSAHIKNTHEDIKKKYICALCSAEFKVKATFDSHMASHTNTVLFSCDYCGQGFTYNNSLRKHIKAKHLKIENKKQFACLYCDKVFKDSRVMREHIRTHTGERPYQCDICQRQFAQRGTMVTHYRGYHKLTDYKKRGVK